MEKNELMEKLPLINNGNSQNKKRRSISNFAYNSSISPIL